MVELEKICQTLDLDKNDAQEFADSLLKSYIFVISSWRTRHLASKMIRKQWHNIAKLKDENSILYAGLNKHLVIEFIKEIEDVEKTYKKSTRCYLWSRHINCYYEIAKLIPFIFKLDENELEHIKQVSDRLNKTINRNDFKIAWKIASVSLAAIIGAVWYKKSSHNKEDKENL